jgi:AraC-like DNA-binding protein
MNLIAPNGLAAGGEKFDCEANLGGGSLFLGDKIQDYDRIISNRVARMEIKPTHKGRFYCRAAATRLRELKITRIQSDPVELNRSIRCIETDSQAQYLVGLSLVGRTVINHSHWRNVIDPGNLFLLDKAMPYQTKVMEAADRILVVMPRHLLETRLPDPAGYLSMTPSTGSGIGRLAREHLQFLAREGHLLSNINQMYALEMCLDLIALAFRSCEEQNVGMERGGMVGGQIVLSRLKARLKCILDDPELDPAKAAGALGLSKRYLHKLFSNSGTTFGTWVREERLMRARLLLTDPRFNHLSITEVAMRQGFNDIPHFSRLFKARFGQTPSDTRIGVPREQFVA